MRLYPALQARRSLRARILRPSARFRRSSAGPNARAHGLGETAEWSWDELRRLCARACELHKRCTCSRSPQIFLVAYQNRPCSIGASLLVGALKPVCTVNLPEMPAVMRSGSRGSLLENLLQVRPDPRQKRPILPISRKLFTLAFATVEV